MTTSPLVRLLSVTRPGLPLRRAPQAGGLLRRRRLLLPGHRLHRRGGAGCSRRRCAASWAPPRWRPGWSAARWPTPPCSRPWWTTSTAATARPSPRGMQMVMNNHIGKGGHLSAQPMGALKDFVAIDPRTDRPAVVNFPVLPGNPYRIDVAGTLELIDQYRPQLIIFGKSMVLHKEPVAEIRRFVDEQGLDTVIMYDMAHVLGLVGASLPAAVRRGRRPRHRLHPQDLLRHPAGRHRRPVPRAGRGTLRAVGGRPPAHLPRLGLQPPPGHHARAAGRHLRDEPLQGRLPDRRSSPTPRPSPGPWRPRGSRWPATRPSTTPRPTR